MTAATATRSNPAGAPPLSPADVETFHRQGFLPVEGVFTDADLRPVEEELTVELSKLAAAAHAEGRLPELYEGEDFEHRLARINEHCPDVASELWNDRLALPSFFRLMSTPRLLDAVEALVGPEVIASSVYRLRPKVPSHKQSAVPWHQDSSYFEPYCDKHLVLTVWVPLVEATEENGCMWVIPGGHRAANRVVEHRQAEGQPYLEITEDGFKECGGAEPLCVPIPRGGCLLMTNLLPHGSFANRTDGVRWSMDLRFQNANLPTNAPITRGDGDLVGDPDAGVPVACYPPDADFLIRSRTRPHEVLTDPDAFVELRAKHLSVPVTNRFAGEWL